MLKSVGGNRTECDYSCTLYKTRTNSHPGRCERRRECDICEFIHNVHTMKELFTRSALAMRRTDGAFWTLKPAEDMWDEKSQALKTTRLRHVCESGCIRNTSWTVQKQVIRELSVRSNAYRKVCNRLTPGLLQISWKTTSLKLIRFRFRLPCPPSKY